MWEAALADSEAARLRLLKENDAFRDVIVACVNILQSLHHTAVSTITKVEMEEPDLILSDALFTSSHVKTQAETAHDKLRDLFKQLREVLSQAGSLGNSRRQSLKQREEDAHQIQALQLANAELKAQIRKLSLNYWHVLTLPQRNFRRLLERRVSNFWISLLQMHVSWQVDDIQQTYRCKSGNFSSILVIEDRLAGN
jgi:chromosome segregation ATPase